MIILAAPVFGGLRAQDVAPVRTGTAVVHGVVVAGDTGAPLAATIVELWSARDSTFTTETLTNETGQFRIVELPEGLYYLRLASLGYGTVTTVPFELAAAEVRNLGTLGLPVDPVSLEPIEVSSERTAVTFEADRTSYNMGVMGVEGSSVTETLQKASPRARSRTSPHRRATALR